MVPVGGLGSVTDSVLFALLRNTFSHSPLTDPSPLFLPPELADSRAQLSGGELIDLLSGLRNTLLNLSTAAATLDLTNPTSRFFSGTATSTDSAAVKGVVVPGVSAATQPADTTYSFTVSQLATAQANVGTALTSTAINTFTTGTNTLRVTQNGTTTDVSFSVGASDTNLTVLTTMADAINDTAGLGVSATVNTDAVANTSQIIIQSTVTGTVNTFTLTDITGNPVADAGVSSATTAAANASYTQNGVALTASTNDLYIGSNAQLHVTLLSTTTSAVVLEVGPDRDLIQSGIDTLVSSFNQAKAFFDSHADLYPGVVTNLRSVASRLSAQLSNIGIETSSSGALSVDSEKLDQALSQHLDRVQSVIGDASGLAQELRAIADTHLSQALSLDGPLPLFTPGQAPARLRGQWAQQFERLRFTGLLVDALI